MKKILLCCLSFLFLASCYVGRDIIWNVADINDYKKFASVEIPKSTAPFHFIEPSSSNFTLPSLISDSNIYARVEDFGTVAFLVIRNDSILYENYPNGYSVNSIVPSFSVAKSFISLLTGIAIDEGYIKSLHDPVVNYLPELKAKGFDSVTIDNVLNMRSGVDFSESYSNPFGGAARYYYGLNLKRMMSKLKVKSKPGQAFDYISVNTQLLGWIIERATGTTVEDYFHKKVWEPLGMEYDATWSVDSKKNKTVKAFCCLNARARDFAKLGRLYLNNGNWNGKQIVSAQWVKQTTSANWDNALLYWYGWWHNRDYYLQRDSTHKYKFSNMRHLRYNKQKGDKGFITSSGDFYAEGILGQYIYVNPAKKIIIVRLGKRNGYFDWSIAMLNIASNY